MSDENGSGELPSRGPERPGRPATGPRQPGGGFFLWVLIFGVILFGIYTLWVQAKRVRREEISISQLYERIEEGKVATVEIRRNLVSGDYRGTRKKGEPEGFTVKILEPETENLSAKLWEYNQSHKDQRIDYRMEPGSEVLQLVLFNFLPVLLIVLFLWYILARQFRATGGAGSVLSFGKARARLHTKEKPTVTFDDVAGIDEAKEEVQELVEFLKNPAKFRRLGGRIPRGILLVGPPGCGKTLLAKAIAGEADVPFFSISGSDFIEMFVGVGASRVRDLFRQAKENAPCIIFLDEVDAVGRRRAIDIHGASAESAQTLNAILVEMDGFDTNDNVIVISATNRPDVLDPALLRPGRFDRQIVVNLPDMRGREAILRVHARKYKLASDVDLRQLARGTPTFSGADLEALMNEAALIATRRSKNAIEMADLEEARDKVRWGRQRRSLKMTEEDRRITAFHESGHALAAKLLPGAEPLHKVSIIPQGLALGMTMSLPEQDRYHLPRKKLETEMAVMLGGRVAEELCVGDITAGAQNDLDRVTDLARAMVCRWGMSERLGPVSYHEADEPQFLGITPLRPRPFSESTAIKIDEEVTRIVGDAYQRVRKVLEEHRKDLETIALNLLKYEMLYAEDIDDILAGREPARANRENPPPRPEPSTGPTAASETRDA